jgi:glucose/arabinose dehydrogenase
MRSGLGVCLLLVACTRSPTSETAHPDAHPEKSKPAPPAASKPVAETAAEPEPSSSAKVEPTAEDLEHTRSILVTKPTTYKEDMGEYEYKTKCGWSYTARMWTAAEKTAGQMVADQLCDAGCTPKLCEKRTGPNDACARTACYLPPELSR